MALTFPRALLAPDQIARVTVRALHQLSRAPSRGGNPGIASFGRDLWQFDYVTHPLKERQAMAWEAWLASLRGGLRTFKALHPLRAYLLAYPAGYGGMTRHGGGAFDGTAVVVSVAPGLNAVAISALPNGLQITAGDHISITYSSGLQALHRVVENVTSVGATATITVEPLLVPGLAAGAAVQLASPWCLAVLDAGTPAAQWVAGRRTEALRFTATQVFL